MLKRKKLELSKSIQDLVQNKEHVLVLSHKKLTFKEIDAVRRKAKETTIIKKVKNKVLAKTLTGTYEALHDSLQKEVILIFTDDIFDGCKAAKSFTTNNKEMQILKAANATDSFEQDSLIKLSDFESKKELQSYLLNVINGVVSKFVQVVKAKAEKN